MANGAEKGARKHDAQNLAPSDKWLDGAPQGEKAEGGSDPVEQALVRGAAAKEPPPFASAHLRPVENGGGLPGWPGWLRVKQAGQQKKSAKGLPQGGEQAEARKGDADRRLNGRRCAL